MELISSPIAPTQQGRYVKSSTIWDQLDACKGTPRDPDRRLWWESSGRFLALLLHGAGYSHETQTQSLRFFLESITPYLGHVRRKTDSERLWHSFMTDDGCPVELSWDWGSSNSAPSVRFSVEPVGPKAGTSEDLYNHHAAQGFYEQVIKNLPGNDLEWFSHFSSCFSATPGAHRGSGDPSTQIFYAFDIEKDRQLAKAYFFPSFEAKATSQDDWSLVTKAVLSAPRCTPANTKAMTALGEFFHDAERSLRLEMFAIDLVKPQDSRIKVYFRSRETQFSDLANAMTLGGRLRGENIQKGLSKLEILWNRLFDLREARSLPPVLHRTAGILYYADFKLGSDVPSVKVYIPVRHYAATDRKIMDAITSFIEETRQSPYVSNFKAVLRDIL